MKFHMATLLELTILQLALHCIERVTDSNADVFMCMMLSVGAARNAFIGWRSDVNCDLVNIALMVMFVRSFNRNSAAAPP